MASHPSPSRRGIPPLAVAAFVIGLALVLGSAAAPSPSTVRENPGVPYASGAAYCYGENDNWGDLDFDVLVQRDISIDCAPSGAVVTNVQVRVSLDHDCSRQLNIRLDKSSPRRSTFLQERQCPGLGGDMELDFSTSYFNGQPTTRGSSM